MMERIELPQGYWIEGNTILQCDDYDGQITVAVFAKGPVAQFNRERREEFANSMNASQYELTRLQEQLRVAKEALKRAREDMEGWQGYCSDYFKNKWDAAGDLAAIDAALEQIGE